MVKLTHRTYIEAHRRKIIVFCMVALIGILFLLPTISAFEFDNWKSYDKANKKATIKNAFGLGDTLAEITLTDNTYTCANFCFAEGETTLYYQRQLIESLRFKKLEDNGWKNSDIKNYNIYIGNGENIIQSIDANGTTITNTETIWKKYNNQILNPGTYKWRIEGEKNPYDTIDWLGTFFGKEIDEWAIWGGVSNMSFRFENNLFPTVGTYNWTNQTGHIFETGKVGQATVIGLNVDKIENGTFLGPGNWTYAFWIKPKSNWNTAIGRVDIINAGSQTMLLAYDRDAAHDGAFDIFGGGTDLSYDIDLAAGDWQHLAISYNGTSILFYVNGTLINSTSKTPYASVSNTAFITNGNVNTDFTLDEFKYFPRALSNIEILNIYSAENDLPLLIIELNSPVNNTEQFNNTLEFTMSGSSATVLTNFSLFLDGVFNQSIEVSGILNSTTFIIENIGNNNHTWFGRTCNATSCVNSDFRNFSIFEFQINSETFNTNSIKGTLETFTTNITLHSGLTITSADFNYNGTITTGSIDVFTNNFILTETITIPDISGTTKMEFFWNITLDSGTIFQTDKHNQTITIIGIDDCGSFGILLLNFTLVDEKSQVLLTGSVENTTVEIDIGLTPRGSTTEIINFSGNFTNKNSAAVCLETNLNNTIYSMDVEVKYSATQYNSEFYNIQNFTVTNSTAAQNITLFDLKTSDAQIFKVTFKDENFLVVQDALIQVQKKFISEGLFKTVEIPKTNTRGEAPVSLEVNDAIYTIIVTKNGQILATFDNVIAICQNPTLQTCEINLNSFSTSISPTDFTVGNDIAFTLTYTPLTRTIESIFSIPSGSVSTMILNVTLFDGLGATEACSNSLTSSSGTLNCVVPINLGNGTVIATITKDGAEVGQSFIIMEQEPEDLYGANLVFLSLIMIMLLVGIGIGDNPMIAGIFFIIGAILLIALNLVDTGSGGFIGTGSTILWLIIAVVIVLIKGAKRQ